MLLPPNIFCTIDTQRETRMSFLPASTPRPEIKWNNTVISLPPSCNVDHFTAEGLPKTTTSSSGSTYIIPFDPGICIKSASELFRWAWNKPKGWVAAGTNYNNTIPTSPVLLGSSSPSPVPTDRVRTTWLGHATCIVEIGGKLVITDPVFSKRCSPNQYMGPA